MIGTSIYIAIHIHITYANVGTRYLYYVTGYANYWVKGNIRIMLTLDSSCNISLILTLSAK